MKKANKIILLFLFFSFTMFVNVSFSATVELSKYCSIPPFLISESPSNVMLVLDYSGSMTFFAYPGDTSGYDPNKTYYGYFKPDKMYKCSKWNSVSIYGLNGYDCYGYWYIDSTVSFSNSNNDTVKYDASSTANFYDSYFYFTKKHAFSGNVLNWLIMSRVDILRWILTGGKIYNSNYIETTFTYSGNSNWWERIKKQDASTYNSTLGQVEGILQEIERLKQKPRIGSILFNGDIIDRIGLSYDYSTLINKINNTSPNGATATKIALDDVEKLFKEKNLSNYGNVDPYEFIVNGQEQKVKCTKNFIIVMSDGEWNTPSTKTSSDPIRPIDEMWRGGTADLVPSLSGNQKVETYSISMFASPTDSGTNALKWMAVYGNYLDKDNNGKPYNLGSNNSIALTNDGYPNTSLTQTENLENLQNNPEVKKNKDNTGPYGFFLGNNPEELKKAITNVFSEILKQASSGSSVSVLSEKNRFGSLMLQAAFYPSRSFSSNYSVDWMGYLFTWWLYNYYANGELVNNIREDTIENKILDICQPNGDSGGDNIIQYGETATKISVYKSTCGGIIDNSSQPQIKTLNELIPVVESGKILEEDNDPLNNRKIYTPAFDDNSENHLIELKDVDNSTIFGDENNDGVIDDDNENYKLSKAITLGNLEKYIYGIDINGYRNRDTGNGIWKLGDIIYSTPKVVDYDNFSVVYVGANDGMLHAFLVGKVKYNHLESNQKLRLVNNINSTVDENNDVGKELWAFIPRNALPYLRVLADPDYCHYYFVDLTPYILRLDTNGDGYYDKIILIGGMRLGGAVGCTDNGCINPPKDTCSNTSSSDCIGLSSYFALDITNPLKPKFLWEFTNKDLGFTYSGPAIVKRGSKRYVVFGSGPDNYKGGVYTDLRFFVLDLLSGKLEREIDTGLQRAFCGRLFNNGVDLNNDGNTDAVFAGATIFDGDINNMKGALVELNTNSDNVNEWTTTVYFNRAITPVTSNIKFAKCFNRGYIYFGTGKWFFKEDNPLSGQKERLYGLALSLDDNGKVLVNANVADVTNDSSAICSDLGNNVIRSWYRELNGSEDGYLKERVLSDPMVSDFNVVFFATTEPTSDICGFGGRSRVLRLNCATGDSILNKCGSYTVNLKSLPQAILLLQTSTGAVHTINAKTSFTENNGMATQWHKGVTPEQPMPLNEFSHSGNEVIYIWEH
ncbi:PilC/PilY family type IV pilus protein [Hippea jasoniae]|uniref:PilC/PilY family type IV pilus protein n=1 Tax=Hippea jasoniae TaxID=944479 RepID=UPI00054E1C77|nr:PilC/PilY family type IV pilus protein [Hippea jasoniae]